MIISEARYESGFGKDQQTLYEALLKERKVAVEYLREYVMADEEDQSTFVNTDAEYSDYIITLNKAILAMKRMYEIREEA